MKTELCLRAHGNDRVLGSVFLPGLVTLPDATRTPQAVAIAYPALVGQITITMLESAVVSQIAPTVVRNGTATWVPRS